jgi:hypothetical protein
LKKVLIMMLALGLAIGLLAVVGCGSNKTTVKTPEGNVTVDESGGDSEVTYGGETYKSSDKAPTEAELGAPVYPGADYVEGSGGSGSITSEGGVLSGASGEFTTSDSFDQVVAYYKGKMGEPMLEETTGEKTAYWLVSKGEETTTTVTVSIQGGKILITLASFGGAGI